MLMLFYALINGYTLMSTEFFSKEIGSRHELSIRAAYVIMYSQVRKGMVKVHIYNFATKTELLSENVVLI